MKKLFTLPILLMFFFCSTSSKAQVIFSEKFDAPSSFPTGWTIANVDKNTPSEADFVTDAWVNWKSTPENMLQYPLPGMIL